ncbi:MAG: zinc-ribbon domain-containing protein [Candidatus Hodarchaeales archaeon]|jgi:uncharacterized membrane protein YvbJ
MNCKNCGNPLLNDSKFCTKCGQRIAQEPQKIKAPFCANCGNSVAPNAKFCMNCGTPITTSDSRLLVSHPTQEALQHPHICIKCGADLLDDDKFCDKCGTPVEPVKTLSSPKFTLVDLTSHCFLCGLPIPPEIILCPRCGVRLNCFKCGLALAPGKTGIHSFCPKCGHRKVSKKLQEKILYFRSLPPLTPDQILSFYV